MRAPVRRVFVSDHQPLSARGLVAILADEPDLMVVTGSAGPRLVVAEAIACQADLAILGLTDHPSEMLKAASLLVHSRPGTRIIVLADAGPEFDISNMLRAGVSGLLSRRASLREVRETVRDSLAGRAVIPSQIASRLVDELAIAVRRSGSRNLTTGLTSRELEVLRLVADGLHNRDVAARLHISENTVKNHMRSVHEKLGVRTRTEAVVTAAREGVLGLR